MFPKREHSGGRNIKSQFVAAARPSDLFYLSTTSQSPYFKNLLPSPFLSSIPTPAVSTSGRTLLSSCGPCLSPSARLRTGSVSWSALLEPAFVSSDGASMVLGPFAETQGPWLPGRTPATRKITGTEELGAHREG